MRVEQVDEAETLDVDTFWHDHLVQQAMVTVGEAYRAVLILADGEDQYTDFAAREQALRERGMIRDAWGLQREACIDRGSVAYMVCRTLEIRGGVNMFLFGRHGLGDRRYANRELVYREMVPEGAAYRYVTGGELMDLLIEADRYMARHGMYDEEPLDIEQVIDAEMDASGVRPEAETALP